LIIVFLWVTFASSLVCEELQPLLPGATPIKQGFLTHEPIILSSSGPGSKILAQAAERARVRELPDLSSNILTVLKSGETIQILGMEGTWFKIRQKGGMVGWVYKDLVREWDLLEKRISQGSSPTNPMAENPPLISLSFRDMDIRDAFSSLAMEFKTNIVLSNEVTGTITLHIFKASLEEAMATIALAGGYTAKKEGPTFHVFKRGLHPILEKPVPKIFETQTFRLNYVEMEKIKETLNSLPNIQPVEVHEETKTIFVEDTRENIEKVARMIKFLDAVPQQVMIEARILEVTLTDDMAYGVDWKSIWGDVNLATSGFSKAALPDLPYISPVPEASQGGFANIIARTGSDHVLSLAIDALKEKTTVNTVSTPKILAIHGKTARVQVGGQQGYKVSTINEGFLTETIQFIDTGVILEITPHIDKDNNILLNVQPTINTAKIEEGIPVVNSTSVSTWLVARDGETVFIGGLIEDLDSNTREQVPLLGDIPVLGNLFGRTITTKTKNEIVILITPRIIKRSRETE
jgi:type IV pilus secretin PilQ/predicted competence protein